jgi:hypothetical protein
MMTNHVNVSLAPYFDGDGSNFYYWKTGMRIHLKAMGGIGDISKNSSAIIARE